MAIAHPVLFSTELCEALGLDPKHIGSLRIEVNPQSPAQVTIVRYLTAEDADHVKRIVEKYELVAKEEG